MRLSAYLRAPLEIWIMNGASRVEIASEQAQGLFHVVDVVGAYGELAVGDLEELLGGDDHVLSFMATASFTAITMSSGRIA